MACWSDASALTSSLPILVECLLQSGHQPYLTTSDGTAVPRGTPGGDAWPQSGVTRCSVSVLQGRENTVMERAGQWPSLSTDRGGRGIKVKFTNVTSVGKPFPNHLSEFILSFLLRALRCNWIGIWYFDFLRQDWRRPDDSVLAVGGWLLGVPAHHHISFQVFNPGLTQSKVSITQGNFHKAPFGFFNSMLARNEFI